uniref:Uncharacterized protein n=1 Tax=Anguilla anguilla TaxID=7936 RepID=A0A0E9WL81_ANGAN
MSMGHRLQAVIACKGYAIVLNLTAFIYISLICSKWYNALKWWEGPYVIT